MDAYFARSMALAKHLDTVSDPNVDMDLVRNFTFSEFHLTECDRIKVSQSPLSAIEYNTVNPKEDLIDRVTDSMTVLPWYEVYGMKLDDVLDLPFDKWWRMSDRLSEYAAKRGAPVGAQQLDQLKELGEKLDLMTDHLALLIKIATPSKRQNDRGKYKRRNQPGRR